VVLIGCGAIGGTVLRLLSERGTGGSIAAIGLRAGSVRSSDLPAGVPVLTDPAALASLDARLVVEAAGRASVAPWGQSALSNGMDFAVTSTSALADPAILDRLAQTAATHGTRLIIPAGALGGIDALAAASRMGLSQVEHRIVKPPQAWIGTEAETLCDLASLVAPCLFFQGTAREAAARFPQNANAAMIVALAGLGPNHSRVTLVADPATGANRHEISATGSFGTMMLQFDNAPLPGNPKSSAMTALGLVRLIENLSAPVVI
jgi:aspartate dehydrogenase